MAKYTTALPRSDWWMSLKEQQNDGGRYKARAKKAAKRQVQSKLSKGQFDAQTLRLAFYSDGGTGFPAGLIPVNSISPTSSSMRVRAAVLRSSSLNHRVFSITAAPSCNFSRSPSNNLTRNDFFADYF